MPNILDGFDKTIALVSLSTPTKLSKRASRHFGGLLQWQRGYEKNERRP